MPTVEERLAALEAKMAQLTDTRPTTYYTHQYSGEEIDAATGRALAGGALDTSVTNVSNQLGTFVRPNLLDNWYFGRPVDQRGGHIVQQGKMAYRDAECTIEAGGVSETAMTVTKVSDTVYTFKDGDGSQYYVKAADVVRGYAGNGYTVDRWITDSKPITIGNGILLDAVSFFYQKLEQSTMDALHGKLITFSALTTSNGFLTGSWVVDNANQSDTRIAENSEIILFRSPWTGNGWGIYAKTATHILAAKLELGPTQTLAHQEAGQWVLNEVPEYGGQLRRCLRHDYIIGDNTDACPICVGTAYSSDGVVAVVDLPEVMRTNPAVSISGAIQIRFSATQNFSVSTVANYGFGGDKVQLYFSGLSGLTPGQSCDLYTQSGSRIEFNANL